jgi:tetratricopeptide (TPR) repeat protein
MESKKITSVRRMVYSIKLSCFILFFMVVSSCSSPNKQYSYFNMLDEHKRTVGNKQAAQKFWAAVRPVSTLSDSHYRLGRHYQQKGKYDKAINEFAKALRNDPSYCKAHNGIAMSYDALRRCQPAHKSYTSAVRCAPDQAYVYNNYGCSSLLCGDYAKGIELLHKAERLAEDNSRIKNNLRIAQMVVNNGNLSDHLAARQNPIPVSDPEPTSSMSKNETSTTNPVTDIPLATLPDVSPDTIAINDPPTESVPPSPSAEVSVERPLLLASEEAKVDSISTATKLLAESEHLATRQEPILVSDQEQTESMPKSETITTNPVADNPIATLPDVSPDTIAINDPPTENEPPSPSAEVNVERPLLFASEEAKVDSVSTAANLLAESDHLTTRQEPIPVSDPEQTELMPKSETITTNPVTDNPIATLPDVSPDTIAINDPPTENEPPSPSAEANVERPLLFAAEEAKTDSVSTAANLLAEADHFDTRQEPTPNSEPEPTISMTKSETSTPNPVADIPVAPLPDITPGAIAIIDPPAEYANPSPPSEDNVEQPTLFSSPEGPKASPTAIKILAEKTKIVIFPRPTIATVEVSNGNGTTGMAGRSATFLRNHGFQIKRVTNAQHFHFAESVIFYREGYLQAAQEIAAVIPGSQDLRKIESMSKPSIGVRVLLGRDLVAMRFPDGFSGVAGFAGHKDEDLVRSSVALAEKSRQY